MAKSTTPYWNTLAPENRDHWMPVKGLEGMAEELTVSIDAITGEYTRLTRFLPGADTIGIRRKNAYVPGGSLHRQRPPV